jgi:hypothetical protein
MKEKINEYPIDKPLSAARRKKIDAFITENSGRLGRPVEHQWDKAGKVLSLASDPVQFEFIFEEDRVVSYASAPFWVKMLFTEKRRQTVDEVIEQMLDEAGFMEAAPAKKKRK